MTDWFSDLYFFKFSVFGRQREEDPVHWFFPQMTDRPGRVKARSQAYSMVLSMRLGKPGARNTAWPPTRGRKPAAGSQDLQQRKLDSGVGLGMGARDGTQMPSLSRPHTHPD